jgi:hypothetical protein
VRKNARKGSSGACSFENKEELRDVHPTERLRARARRALLQGFPGCRSLTRERDRSRRAPSFHAGVPSCVSALGVREFAASR